jgi:acyl carrier protein phosphodiesterase
MNLLAHAILSPPGNDPLLVGNLTADWIKGRSRRALPPAIQFGFIVHRHIDGFTDTHPLVAACIERLSDKWNRYAGILVDIFFDHLLAVNWQRYTPHPLQPFVAGTYATLRAHRPLLPEATHYAVDALTTDDWFSTYATLDGIRLTLARMSMRLRARGHSIDLAPSVDDFPSLELAFHSAFARFFPELQHHIATLEVLQPQ